MENELKQDQLELNVKFVSKKEFNDNFCHYPKISNGIFFYPIKKPTIILQIEGLTYGIIVHECVHACQYVMQYLKKEMDYEDQAYFIGGLVTQIIKKAKSEAIKINN